MALPKGKAVLNLYCNDIFETGQISPAHPLPDANVTNHYSCFRELGVSFHIIQVRRFIRKRGRSGYVAVQMIV